MYSTFKLISETVIHENPYFSIDANVFSTAVKTISFPYGAVAKDGTRGGDGQTRNVGGLKEYSVSVTLVEDYAVSGINEKLFALVGTVIAIKIRPTTDALGTSNPEFRANMLLQDFPLFGGFTI